MTPLHRFKQRALREEQAEFLENARSLGLSYQLAEVLFNGTTAALHQHLFEMATLGSSRQINATFRFFALLDRSRHHLRRHSLDLKLLASREKRQTALSLLAKMLDLER